ncbi:hypothetical protein Glove_606g196 [Diversispora epigaea]|uniref:Uncharacterized protein n=1 Tax=Diversispora epigaea TaxID=1348612 RepID=A0A397GF68_9GLOM|nr:hypothetical protein Glove_606g196 [Diversispora epigaea]
MQSEIECAENEASIAEFKIGICREIKIEDVNLDRKKKYVCQDNGIFLLEVRYDEKPEIVIPQEYKKLRS